MADRALRGMTIGAKSMESEEGVEFAERQMISYECPLAHVVVVPMSLEAEIPQSEEPKKAPRTHWDMLLERRDIDDLKVLLDERLDMLRSGEIYRERF